MSSEQFQILEHTADVRIKARGKTLPKLFVNMMKGMFAAMKPKIARNAPLITRAIAVKSPDREALLIDFLNEVLYLGDTNQEIYNKAIFTKFSDTKLSGKLFGQKRGKIRSQVKAATYHEIHISEHNGIFESTVILDI